MTLRLVFVFVAFTLFHCAYCQDTVFIKVHFLYGSKPKSKYNDVEKKWFGGKPGGHVGIEYGDNKYYSFFGSGKQHIFEKKKNKHSAYTVIDSSMFWGIMGSHKDSIKRLTIVLPLHRDQANKLDSITKAYLAETPYDYAVFGMRCGSSTYEILAQLGVLKSYSHFWTYMKIFYPRRLRKRLIAKAEDNQWMMIKREGTDRRKWEKDVKYH